MPKLTEQQIDAVTKAATDEGKIIEAGWIGFRLMAYPDGAPTEQLEQLRQTFFAGAQHLYTSILRVLDPGDEPTDADLSRMGLIDAELKAFIEDFQLRHIKTEGKA